MPFEIDGKLTTDAFSHIEPPKGAKVVVFRRLDFQPYKVQTDRGVVDRPIGSVGIPCEFTGTLVNAKESADMNRHHVRYYDSVSEEDSIGGARKKVYEPMSIAIEGETIKFDVTNAQGIERFRFFYVHSMNGANSDKGNPNMPKLFEMFEPEKIAKTQNAKTISRNKAVALVYNEDKVPHKLAESMHRHILQNFPQRFTTGTEELVATQNYEQIRFDLSNFATQKPEEFTRMVEDAQLSLRAEIGEAVKAGIISFSKAESQWKWGDKVEGKKNPVLTIVPIGEDNEDTLITYFVHDRLGKKALEDMRSELKAKTA